MLKVSKKQANFVSSKLDKVADLIQKQYKVLGINKRIAFDFAERCDMLSDDIEKRASINHRADFNPMEIGIEKAGPLEFDDDEPWMEGEFTQQENRELSYDQEEGLLGMEPNLEPATLPVGKQACVNTLSSMETEVRKASLNLVNKRYSLSKSLKKLASLISDAQFKVASSGMSISKRAELLDTLSSVTKHLNSKNTKKLAKLVGYALKLAEDVIEDDDDGDDDVTESSCKRKASLEFFAEEDDDDDDDDDDM